MAVCKEDYLDIDLITGTTARTFMNKAIGEGDANGNRYGVRLFKDKTPEVITGKTCVGYFIRPDGITLIINGAVNENTAYVELPAAAYAIPGSFTLTIKIASSDFVETVRIVDGTIVDTFTGSIYDPASEIPSVEEFLEYIDDAEAAAEDIAKYSVTVTQITGTRYKIGVSKTT